MSVSDAVATASIAHRAKHPSAQETAREVRMEYCRFIADPWGRSPGVRQTERDTPSFPGVSHSHS